MQYAQNCTKNKTILNLLSPKGQPMQMQSTHSAETKSGDEGTKITFE